jgi:hypothetical protein
MSIMSDSSEGKGGAANRSDTDQGILDAPTVATTVRRSPGDHVSILLDGSKGSFGTFDLLHIHQFPCHFAAVSATRTVAPGHDSPIFQYGSESIICS